jgi:hypothetical protein
MYDKKEPKTEPNQTQWLDNVKGTQKPKKRAPNGQCEQQNISTVLNYNPNATQNYKLPMNSY